MGKNWTNKQEYVLQWDDKTYETTNSSKAGARTAIVHNKKYGFSEDEKIAILSEDVNEIVFTKLQYQLKNMQKNKNRQKPAQSLLSDYSRPMEGPISREGMIHEVAYALALKASKDDDNHRPLSDYRADADETASIMADDKLRKYFFYLKNKSKPRKDGKN